MMRLTRTPRNRVSNSMAMLAVFLLIGATAASLGGALDNGPGDSATLAGNSATASAGPVTSARADKGFKVSLFLFRRN